MLRKTDEFTVRAEDGEELQILAYRLDGVPNSCADGAVWEFRTEDGEAVSRITDSIFRVLAKGRDFRRVPAAE